MEVFAARLDRAYRMHENEYEQKALEILRSGSYILGKELAAFEAAFAAYIGAPYCVGLASGLDALRIAFRTLGLQRGDEVIVQGNTFIAGVMGITDCGATPVFAEPDGSFAIDPASVEAHITPRTRAVLVTHLYGMMTPMEPLAALCEKHGLIMVEDCAQSHGAAWRGKKAGSFGRIACFSFYPTKNLGGFGDGGAVVTSDAALAERIRVFRSYGSEKKYYNCMIGANSRLDELQAGLLNVRLRHLDALNAERRELARRYAEGIGNPLVRLPRPHPETENVWHQYVVRCGRRDALQAFLEARGVHTLIHYPVPPHLSGAYRYLGLSRGCLPKTEALSETVLSLPLYNGMTREEQDYVTDAVNSFV